MFRGSKEILDWLGLKGVMAVGRRKGKNALAKRWNRPPSGHNVKDRSLSRALPSKRGKGERGDYPRQLRTPGGSMERRG